MKNSKQRFMFKDLAIRAEFCQLDDQIEQFLAAHDYPPVVQQLLVETLMCTVLLTSALKFEGKLSIQAQSQSMSDIIFVEATHDFTFRGYARHESQTIDWVKKGQCVVTISPNKGQRYQGIVELNSPSMAKNIEQYFAQSEQLPTRLYTYFDAQKKKAAALLLQQLPQEISISEDDDGWNRIEQLSDTLQEKEALSWDTATLIQHLYVEENVVLFDAQDVRFQCNCSRQKLVDVLRQFPADELRGLMNDQKVIESHCEFCATVYRFDAVEVEELIQTGIISDQNEIHEI
ncbi:MAG: Hsp33 family molecular chaperone HslO [Pseudomonadota bacterium]|nr:Hsp33 family molecular chaperone HslO [Pseudomonadota bacterium]